MEFLELLHQLFLRLLVIGIGNRSINRADRLALRRIVKTNTFGAPIGVDHIAIGTLRNSLIGAFGLAGATANASIADH